MTMPSRASRSLVTIKASGRPVVRLEPGGQLFRWRANGALKQHGTTGRIAIASRNMRFNPGDVPPIEAPAGVGIVSPPV